MTTLEKPDSETMKNEGYQKGESVRPGKLIEYIESLGPWIKLYICPYEDEKEGVILLEVWTKEVNFEFGV